MQNDRVFKMAFAGVYPHYVQNADRKVMARRGRSIPTFPSCYVDVAGWQSGG